MAADYNVVIAYAIGIVILYLLARVFLVPLKLILKLVFNALIGGIAILVVNFFGKFFGFHIALNIITAFLVGILGIPGLALLVVIKMLFGI